MTNSVDQTVDSLLDETLDDLADLPSSKPFPAGAHQALMFITKPDPKKPSMYCVKFKHEAVLEMASATAEAPKPGDEAVMFIHTKKKDGAVNEFGQGQLKMILSPLAERLGTTSIAALVEATKPGIQVGIVCAIKAAKDEYQEAMVLQKIQLV